MKLFIANLDFKVTSDQLQEMFSVFGNITECKLIKENSTGQSKGYGFVGFAENLHGQWAIKAMNGLDINGRTLVVRKAEVNNPSKNGKNKRPRIAKASHFDDN